MIKQPSNDPSNMLEVPNMTYHPYIVSVSCGQKRLKNAQHSVSHSVPQWANRQILRQEKALQTPQLTQRGHTTFKLLPHSVHTTPRHLVYPTSLGGIAARRLDFEISQISHYVPQWADRQIQPFDHPEAQPKSTHIAKIRSNSRAMTPAAC